MPTKESASKTKFVKSNSKDGGYVKAVKIDCLWRSLTLCQKVSQRNLELFFNLVNPKSAKVTQTSTMSLFIIRC